MGKGPIPLFYFYLPINGLFQCRFPSPAKFTVEKPAQAVRALALFAVTFPLIFIFEVTAFDWLVGCAKFR